MKEPGLHSMDPVAAKRRISAAKSNGPFMEALLNRDHRGHKEAVGQWTRLHEAALSGRAASVAGGDALNVSEPSASAMTGNRTRDAARPSKQTRQEPPEDPRFANIDGFPGGPQGPIVTFHNDVQGGPHRDVPVRGDLAEAVEEAVRRLGLNLNVNSTRRDNSTPHSQGRAVDINRIDGMRVDEPANRDNVDRLQRELMTMPGINQVLGPVHNVDIDPSGRQAPVTREDVIEQHRDHIHVNVRR